MKNNRSKFILIASSVGLVLALIFFLGKNFLLERYVKTVLEEKSADFGLPITIDHLSGSVFGSLRADGVKYNGPAGTVPPVSFTVASLKFTYSLLDLRHGLVSFVAKSSIAVDGGTIKVQAGKGDENKSSANNFDPAILADIVAGLPNLDIQHINLQIFGSDLSAEVADLSVHAGAAKLLKKSRPVEIKATKMRLAIASIQEQLFALNASFLVSSESLVITEIELGDLLELRQGVMSLSGLVDGRLNCAATILHGTGSLKVTVDGPLDGNKTVGLVVNDFEPGPLTDRILPTPLGLGGRVSGTVEMVVDGTDFNASTLQASLAIKDPSWEEIKLDEINGELSAAEGLVSVKFLEARMAESRLRIDDGTMPLYDLLSGNFPDLVGASRAAYEFQTQNLPRFLAAVGYRKPLPAEIPSHAITINGTLANGRIIQGGNFTSSQGQVTVKTSEFRLLDNHKALAFIPTYFQATAGITDLADLAGLVSIPNLSGGLQMNIALENKNDAPLLFLDLQGRQIVYEKQALGTINLLAEADKAGVAIKKVEMISADLSLSGHGRLQNNIFVDPWPQGWRDIPGDLALQADLRDCRRVGEIFDLPIHSGGLLGDLTFKGTVNEPQGSMKLTGHDLAYGDFPPADLEILATAADRRITFQHLEIHQGEKNTLTGQGSYHPATEGLTATLTLKAALGEYNFLLPERFRPAEGELAAQLEASGTVQQPVIAGNASITGSKFGIFTINKGHLDLGYEQGLATIKAARFESDLGQLDFAGSVRHGADSQPVEISLSSLAFTKNNEIVRLDGPASATISTSPALKITEDIRLRMGHSLATITGTIVDENINVGIDVVHFQGSDLIAALTGRPVRFSGADFGLKIEGPVATPAVKAKGRVQHMETLDQSLSLAVVFDFEIDKNGLVIRKFQADNQDGIYLDLSASLPIKLYEKNKLQNGPLAVRAELDIADFQLLHPFLPVEFQGRGALKGSIGLSGTPKNLAGEVSLQAENIFLPAVAGPLPTGPYNLETHFLLEPEFWRLLKAEFSGGPDLLLKAEGSWHHPPALTDLSGDLAELPGEITLKGGFQVGDLHWIATKVPVLAKTKGQLDSEFDISGSFQEPLIDATVNFSGGTVNISRNLPSFRNIGLEAALHRKNQVSVKATGDLGGSPVTMNGDLFFDATGINRLDLTLGGENLLLYRGDGLKIRSDANLTMQGPVDQLSISGELKLTDSRFSRNFDYMSLLKGSSKPKTAGGVRLFSIPDPPLKEARFDVRVSAASPFLLKNNMARGSFRPDLKLTGTGELPVLAGRIYVDPGSLKLPSGRLLIHSGVVRFPEGSPDQLLLDINGGAKLMGYDITVTVQGTAAEPVVTLSSSPPLPESELLLLLLAGQPPTRMTGQPGNKAGMNVAVYLGRDLLEKMFDNGSAADDSVLERLDVEIGRGVTRQGDQTIDAKFLLKKDVWKPDSELYLTSEKDQFDNYNTGVKIVFRFE